MGSVAGPAYRRVLEDLRAQIRDTVLEPGSRVPSRKQIMARYGVGETAAKHALQVLAAEGLIEARAGSGSYVRKVAVTAHLEHDRPHFPGSPFGLAEGRPASTLSWEHQTEQLRAPRQIARRLRLAETDLVIRTRYLLTTDGHPVQLATSHEPAALTAGTEVALPEEGPLAGRGVVERMRAIGITVDELVEDIWVRPALSAEAAVLDIPPGAPVVVVMREHRAGDRVVETGEIVISPDRFTLRYRIPVPRPAPEQAVAAVAGMPG
jgi:DNA-binding GntR family transcriptional regulator